jgi:hypothetical protein
MQSLSSGSSIESLIILLHNLLIGSFYSEEWENGWREDSEEEDIEYEHEEQFVPINVEVSGRCRRDDELHHSVEWLIPFFL